MVNQERKKGANSRAVRLEAELRANLKKRKELARARGRLAADGGDVAAAGEKSVQGKAGD